MNRWRLPAKAIRSCSCLWLFGIAMFAGCGESPDATGTSTRVAESVREGFENGLGEQAIQDAISLARQQPGVQDAWLSEDNATIIIQFNDGLFAYVVTDPFDAPAEITESKVKLRDTVQTSQKRKLGDFSQFLSPSQKTVAIYSPIQDADPGDFDLQAIANSFTTAGFTINGNGDAFRWANANANLDSLQHILQGQYGVVILLTHGGIGNEGKVILGTREPYDRLVHLNTWSGTPDLSMQVIDSEIPPVFAFNSDFVKRFSYDDSIVLVMACHSLENETMARAFTDNGACGYIGFTDTIHAWIMKPAVKILAESLSNGYTVQQAVDITRQDPYLVTLTVTMSWFQHAMNVDLLSDSPVNSDCTLLPGPPTPTLALSVTPAQSPVFLDPGSVYSFTCIVTSNGVAVADASIPVSDPVTGQSVNPLKTNANGQATYVVTANQSGNICFGPATKNGYDPSGVSPLCRHVALNNTNVAPFANNLSVSVEVNTAKGITLTGSDADGDSLTFEVVEDPSHGDLTGAPPTLTFTPHTNFTGADSFKFNASDGVETSENATVTISVLKTDTSGYSWSALGTGMNNVVFGLTVSGGNLVAAGDFTTAGGTGAIRIAQWDGTSWSTLGTGFDDYVNALTLYNNKLIAAGGFNMAGGVSANSVAQWDGTSWSALGAGINGGVYPLTVYNGYLITAGGTAGAEHINQWDGTSWSSLGTTMDGSVRALMSFNGNLIAGGTFDTTGATPVNGITQWNGVSWSALGTGVSEHVYALSVYDGKLIVGGWFTTAGGAPANHVAQWDGSSWSSLGTGMNGYVTALTVYDDHLIAAGFFTTAGGVSANRIAQWDGTSWSALGTGMDSRVFALNTYDGQLIAGGEFTTAGGTTANRIAKWGPVCSEDVAEFQIVVDRCVVNSQGENPVISSAAQVKNIGDAAIDICVKDIVGVNSPHLSLIVTSEKGGILSGTGCQQLPLCRLETTFLPSPVDWSEFLPAQQACVTLNPNETAYLNISTFCNVQPLRDNDPYIVRLGSTDPCAPDDIFLIFDYNAP